MSVANLRNQVLQIIRAGIAAVDPYRLVKEQVKPEKGNLCLPNGEIFRLDACDRVFIFGAGKGAVPMAVSLRELLGDKFSGGVVITKYGHAAISGMKNPKENPSLQIFEASHPLPDEKGLQATRVLLDCCQELTEKDLAFVVITGGGSALMEYLPQGISLADLQQLNQILLESGAGIHQINTIRKHISLIKGGQLARAIAPAACVSLILSDVIGDRLSVIASGPTAPDESTFQDAMELLEQLGIRERIPANIANYLQAGLNGKIPETPKAGDPIFNNVSNTILGNIRLCLKRAAQEAEKLGYNPVILTSRLHGEAREVAGVLADIVREVLQNDEPVKKPACLLTGGETTVHIKGSGKGGRNQELALAFALNDIQSDFCFASCGTDGTDGPTNAAGAVVDTQTPTRAKTKGLDARTYLKNNDAWHFFKALDDLIITGPTGTNVMDMQVALIP